MSSKNREIKLGTHVNTPDGEIRIGLVKYDPKKDEYFYSVFGSKCKWYNEKDVTVCEKQPKIRKKKLKTGAKKTKSVLKK